MDLFSSPIGRLAFLGRQILGFVLLTIGNMTLIVGGQRQSLILIVLSSVLIILVSIYIILFCIFPRLASIGLSRWFVLVSLVPVVNFLFLIFMFVCPAGWLIKHDKVT